MSPTLADEARRVTQDDGVTHLALLDGSGAVVAVNAAWSEFSRANGGDEAATGVGTDYLHVCATVEGPDGADARRVAEALRLALTGAPERVVAVYPCHGPDERRWFEVRLRPVTGAAGVVVEHVPVTERMLMDVVAQTLAVLGGSPPTAQDLDALSESLSHDEATARAVLPRLGEIRDLLARSETTGLVDLRTLTNDAIDRTGSARDDVDVRVDAPGEPVEADERVLGLILMELLANALRHAAHRVVVGARPTGGGGLQLWVDDDGPGLPPALAGRVRTGRVARAVLDGEGIGVTVARGMTHHLGGWLLLEEGPLGGVRARVEL